MREGKHHPTSKARFEWLTTIEGSEVGEYVLEKYVGAGKIGYVYRSRSKTIPEIQRAVKLIPEPRKGWDNEVRKVARLATTPNVVHFHHLGTSQVTKGDDTTLVQYTVWDYIAPGQSLREFLQGRESIPASFVLAIINTVLRVLHACQQMEVLRHGDLHAGNILIGEQNNAQLDATLQPVDPVFVSDFGFGTSGGIPQPKDDYLGLADIANTLISKVDWSVANSSDRQLLRGTRDVLGKMLREQTQSEKTPPLGILQALLGVRTLAGRTKGGSPSPREEDPDVVVDQGRAISVGQYQISEMLGDDWELWKTLFVPGVPARSRILERDITSVITGPRGCGKTMLFRRLSERLIVECGPIDGKGPDPEFVGFYVNANDIADAFAHFPHKPSEGQMSRLYCFTHLCILSDVLAVEAALARRSARASSIDLVRLVADWFGDVGKDLPVVTDEDRVDRYRSVLEQHKRSFLRSSGEVRFPACEDFGHHSWLRTLVPALRKSCPWMGGRTVFFFIDDYTTPRVSLPMQRALNRIFFQRSSEFVFKVATEAATTFLAEDESGKTLQTVTIIGWSTWEKNRCSCLIRNGSLF